MWNGIKCFVYHLIRSIVDSTLSPPCQEGISKEDKCKITRIFNIVLALVFISPGKYMSVYMYPHLIQQEHAQYWISYSNKMHGKTEFSNEEAFNTFVSLYRALHLWNWSHIIFMKTPMPESSKKLRILDNLNNLDKRK